MPGTGGQSWGDNRRLRFLRIGSRRGCCSWVCYAARRRAGLRPQFSCSFVDSPLAGRPLFFGTLLLTAVIFAQSVCFRYFLRDLIFQPLPHLSVNCLDRFEVHRRFPSPHRFQPGPQGFEIMCWFAFESKPFLLSRAPICFAVFGQLLGAKRVDCRSQRRGNVWKLRESFVGRRKPTLSHAAFVEYPFFGPARLFEVEDQQPGFWGRLLHAVAYRQSQGAARICSGVSAY